MSNLLDEVYSIVNKHDGHEYTFFTTAMVKWAERNGAPISTITIGPEAIAGILAGDTIEPAKLRRVRLDDDRPIVVVEWPPGQGHSIVDGNHRVIRKHMSGVHEVRAWVWPLGAWERFAAIDLNDPFLLMAKAMELVNV